MNEIIKSRRQIVKYLYQNLIGPGAGVNEQLSEPAFSHYTAGTLYPPQAEADSVIAEEEQDGAGLSADNSRSPLREEQGDDPVTLSNQNLPASFGLSFYLINDPRLRVVVSAARYLPIELAEKKKGRKRSSFREGSWRRTPVSTTQKGQRLLVEPQSSSSFRRLPILDGKAQLYVIWRPTKAGWLVTVSVINIGVPHDHGDIDPQECLHQVRLVCLPVDSGLITAYPHSRLFTDDNEEHILDLLYRHQVAYGVGHGCSVAWGQPVDGGVSYLHSEFLPHYEVPPISYDLEGDFDEIRSIYFLANGEEYPEKLINSLNRFVSAYKDWFECQPGQNADIPADLLPEKDTLMERLRQAADRMESGVLLLRNNPLVLRAFCLANRAMLLQHVHSLPQFAGRRRPVGTFQPRDDNLENFQDRLWRPFQLAFQLLTLASVAFPEDPFRRVVDLIWFPTGGGKTEAYLAVTAFLIFYRRIMHGHFGSGTAILMRYTLRLLTTQQFQRASTLLCACELLRRQFPEELGQEEISIGLWVGGETTPNSFQDAFNKYEELIEKEHPQNPFQIDRCPWCGTEIIPARQSLDLDHYGVNTSPESFFLFCPSVDCVFHTRLPVEVVDDQIYANPPTLLLATVDKFARMPWLEKISEIFGGHHRRPPELIIQDELHLISGPLGTIVGIYEVAVDVLASWDGIPPKILSSTATIRRADEQCYGLYERNVQLFPPAGLDASDSYFARYDKEKPGRLYVGVMGQGHTASTSFIRTSAALLQAPVDLKLQDESLDAFWTLVGYHNSLRELGKTLTFAADDIPARIKVISLDQSFLRDLDEEKVVELTSNRPASALVAILNRLNCTADDPEAISFLVCSNMLSVGVDVSRLGLMLVNGQPKSTSEYIQATSRVGRKNPGLVVTLLSPTKPRDRSHYERFIAFHAALYRFVEPGSVTPFAPPVRDRALHAVLVSAIRHGMGLSSDDNAGDFSLNLPGVDRLIRFIGDRVAQIDPLEAQATIDRTEELLEEWEERASQSGRFVYYNTHPSIRSLLRPIGDSRKDGWDTLNSMRNVDRSSLIKIVARRS